MAPLAFYRYKTNLRALEIFEQIQMALENSSVSNIVALCIMQNVQYTRSKHLHVQYIILPLVLFYLSFEEY